MPSLLRLHVERVHKQGSPPALICHHCGKGAAGYRGLQIHMAHTHKIYRASGKGQQTPIKDKQHATSRQQVCAPAIRKQMMKSPHQHREPVYHKIPPSLKKNAQRSMSADSSTRRSSKPLIRRSSTTNGTFICRSSDSCDYTSTLWALQVP